VAARLYSFLTEVFWSRHVDFPTACMVFRPSEAPLLWNSPSPRCYPPAPRCDPEQTHFRLACPPRHHLILLIHREEGSQHFPRLRPAKLLGTICCQGLKRNTIIAHWWRGELQSKKSLELVRNSKSKSQESPPGGFGRKPEKTGVTARGPCRPTRRESNATFL